MIFYPKAYFNQIEDITVEYLKANNIKGLILDVDNTLIDKKKFMRDTTKKWAEGIKNAGIKMCILSNSSNKTKVDKIAKEIDINYSYFATKPLKRGFKKARKELDLLDENIAVIGDQVFTDVLGSNRNKMFSILVKPIEKDTFFASRIKRGLENIILKKYHKTKKDS